MSCPQVVGTFPFTLYVAGTETAWLPIANPLLIHGSDTLEMTVKIARATGDAEASAGVELFKTRADVANGDPTAATGGYSGTNGASTHYTYDLSADTTNFYVQPGILGKRNTTTPGFVQGTITNVLGSCGRLIGQREIESFPFEDTARPMSYTIGGWQPALNASKLRAVLLGSNINDADWLFLARLANDIDKPTAPSLLGSFTSFSPDGDGNTDVNSGVIDLTSLSAVRLPVHPDPARAPHEERRLRPEGVPQGRRRHLVYLSRR